MLQLVVSTPEQSKPRVAIIGGGPGGLFSAYYLERYAAEKPDVCILECSARVGGKIFTPRMPHTGFKYEAGVAEIYDYAQLGPDPLKELIAELGLTTTPMDGEAVIFEGQILTSAKDVHHCLGPDAATRLETMAQGARMAVSPDDYYHSDWERGRHDPGTRDTFAQFLDDLGDDRVRRFIETVVHSDLATQPHKTSASYGLQNWLMNEPDYMKLYSIDGGNERLISELVKRIETPIRLNTRVSHIITRDDGRYDVISTVGHDIKKECFDKVVIALPVPSLSQIVFVGQSLDQAMREHIRHYDHPAHYLRITVAFTTAFWREFISGSFFMVEAFGGACVYDESSRDANGSDAVLSWLLAGDAAMVLNNATEDELLREVLASLPSQIRPNKSSVIEAHVHRWVGAVNAWPMGIAVQEPDSRHMPDQLGHPNLFVVGDYLFDSTVNGVMDSADTVAQLILDINLDGQTDATTTRIETGETIMPISRRFIRYVLNPASQVGHLRHFQHPESEFAADGAEDSSDLDGLIVTFGNHDLTHKSSVEHISAVQSGVAIHWSRGEASISSTGEKAEQFIPALLDFDHLQREKVRFEKILSSHEAQAVSDVKRTYEVEHNGRADQRRLIDVMENLARQRLRMARCLPLTVLAQPDLSKAGARLYLQLCEKSEINSWLTVASDRLEALEDLYEGAIDRNNDLRAWKKSNAMEIAIIVVLLAETIVVFAQLLGFKIGS
ncbi:MAG: FAD-dependent oxidoreductase [Pseudomonadota bacterium]|nr:FAD-dependent oxidoreductase [Pseudomonadota bacterium]